MRPTRSCGRAPATRCNGEVFNVGGDRADQPSRPHDAARSRSPARVASSTSSGRPRRRRSTSAASTPTRRSSRATTGWAPPVPLRDGLRRTIAFYRAALRPLRRRAEPERSARVTRAPHSVHVAGARRGRRRRAARRSIASIARGWFVLGPEVDGVRGRIRRRVGRGARGRRRHRHRRDRADPARARHRRRRRGDHDAAVGRVQRARDHDGRRAAGVRRHRSGAPDDRSRARSPRAIGPRTRAILPVHLYGQPADMAAIERDRGAAQPRRSSRTAARRISRPRAAGRSAPSASPARSASTRRRISARSATAARSSPTIARSPTRSRRLRNGGQTDRYHHQEPGINSRLDEMQAAILRARLPRLRGMDASAAARSRRRYRGRLGGQPGRRAAASSTPATSTICSSSAAATRRDLQAHLAARGIETLIHYPVPIPRQPALAAADPAECPVARARLRRDALAAASPGLARRRGRRRLPRPCTPSSRGPWLLTKGHDECER